MRLSIIACILAACLELVQPAGPPPEPRVTLAGTVVNIVDGDTEDIEFRIVVRFRLVSGGKGCWSPESRTKNLVEKQLGLAAKQSLKDASLDKPCLVTIPVKSIRLIDYMTMERVLGDVWVEGESMGAMQVRTKHASTTKGGKLGE